MLHISAEIDLSSSKLGNTVILYNDKNPEHFNVATLKLLIDISDVATRRTLTK